MRAIAAFLFIVALALVAAPGLARAGDGLRFVAISYHEVVDSAGELDGEAVTTDRFVGFLEWVKAGGMRPVTLDDIDAARRGVRPLPDRAILITFDDGYRSLYTRVYPLLLAYRIPVVAALVGEWMDAPLDATVRYGERDVPRRKFITWDEAREMTRSGLVEFASHSYALHRGVRANPQGSERPAATARRYDPATGYESESEFRERLAQDFARSMALHRRELGVAPRALAWPFGRYRGAALEVAKEAGFTFAFMADSEPASAAVPFVVPRFLPSDNPPVGDIVANLRFGGRLPPVQTFACLDPARLAEGDFEVNLGKAIERLRRLGATAVVLEPFVRDAGGRAIAAWFPTSAMPVRADVLSRIAWQMHTRAGVEVYVRLPRAAAQAGMPAGELATHVGTLAVDLAAHVPMEGVFIEDAPALAAGSADEPGAPWLVRARRGALDGARLPEKETGHLAAFRAIERESPKVRLAILAPAGAAPSSIADVTFVPVTGDTQSAIDAVAGAGGFVPGAARRLGPWIAGREVPDASAIAAIARAFRRRGSSVVGWCPDDPVADRPEAAAVAPAVSSSTFPVGAR